MSITLFDREADCCGCSACVNACPRKAITMTEDGCGFVFPRIDADRCVECGACKFVCGYQNPPAMKEPVACYAAAAKDRDVLKKSASGGVFAVLAEEMLKRSGVVYGAAMPLEDSGFQPKHIRVDAPGDLSLLQGSKYVQSDIGLSYRSARRDLAAGKEVLFSGTPCQIAGLLKFLGTEYDNLVTAEVICHGVPNARMFRDFIAAQETALGEKICVFSFRSKEKGQGETVRLELRDDSGKLTGKLVNGHACSYMHYFLKSDLCRSSCYACPFAGKERIADLTLGDYWGFHQEYPRVKTDSGLSDGTGVSCVLVNTERGEALLNACGGALTTMQTRFEKIARHNMQLNRPCRHGPEREGIMDRYRESGYSAVEKYYRENGRTDRVKHTVLAMLPKGIKRGIKRAMGLLKQN